MSWIWQGRQLATAEKGGTTLSYTYDSEGIRTSKSDGTNTTKYLLNGTQILAQTTNGKTLCFFYDQQGNRVAMADSGNHFYYYIYNVQGDVIALADASTGKLVVTYTYDAWGMLMELKDTTANSVGTLNPFRYRGYYYDTETSLYYLQSRYYDPDTGRFINADAHIVTDQNSALAANMYSYCQNNPVNNDDPSGEFLNTIFGAVFGAAFAVITRDRRESWQQAAVRGAVTGAISGLGVDICVATGGVGGLLIAAAGGAICGGLDKIISKKNVGEKATVGEVATSAVVGAGVNLTFGAYGRVGARVVGKNVKEVFNAMWQNTRNSFLSPKGNFSMPKTRAKVTEGVAGAVAGSFLTWYGNIRVGNG